MAVLVTCPEQTILRHQRLLPIQTHRLNVTLQESEIDFWYFARQRGIRVQRSVGLRMISLLQILYNLKGEIAIVLSYI